MVQAWALPIPNFHFELSAPAPSPSLTSTPVVSASGVNSKGAAYLVIDKIRLNAPIQRDVPINDEKIYDQALEKGVALARGTAELESSTGNSFLFAHSSRLSWHPSPNDTLFAAIPRLEPEDIIKVEENGRTDSYKVTLSQSIQATDLSFLRDDHNRKITLVTCWPLGWDASRWVVQAEKI